MREEGSIQVAETAAGNRHVVRGIVCALAGGICWGFSGTCAQLLMNDYGAPATWITCVRMVIAAVFFLFLTAVRNWRDLVAVFRDWRSLAQIAAFAIFGVLLTQLSYLNAISYTSAGVGTTIEQVGLVLIMLYVCGRAKRLPRAREAAGLVFALGGMLIIGAVMCGINPVMGMINTAMTNWLNALGGSSKVLLGAIVAGMMSVDMGGPVNKAAYVFGTAALASGNYEVMAAVMVGGMVPPIAIALSTTFCPRKWTPDDRRNGIVNYVMGLCFVSEGAIPYAAADPLRVLPSCVIGSAVSGALSMTFGCALRAPHGGIFVFPVVDHAALYCVALAVGSVLGAVILSLVKKTQPAEAK